MAEAAIGLGNIIGPVLGSFIYGFGGYDLTMYIFAGFTLLIALICAYFLPSSLNENDEDFDVFRKSTSS